MYVIMWAGLLVLVYCDEVNREKGRGLRIFHVGGSTVYVGEFNGVFKMTGVGYSGSADDRFGACDYSSWNSGRMEFLVWSVGGCLNETYAVGMYAVNDYTVNDEWFWVGACLMRS